LAPPHSSCLTAPFWEPTTGATSTQRDEDPGCSSDEEYDKNPEINTIIKEMDRFVPRGPSEGGVKGPGYGTQPGRNSLRNQPQQQPQQAGRQVDPSKGRGRIPAITGKKQTTAK